MDTQGELVDGDVALVLSSIVDYRRETRWADAMRARGVRVGFIGLAASKMPELFQRSRRLHLRRRARGGRDAHARTARSRRASCRARRSTTSTALPFPRWDLVSESRPCASHAAGRRGRSAAASRCSPAAGARSSAPIARTGFWPATARARSIDIVDEIEALCDRYPRPYVIFRDPAVQRRTATAVWRSATRSSAAGSRSDVRVRDAARSARRRAARRAARAGLRAMSFGVESMSPATLKKVGPPADSAGASAADHRHTAGSSASSRRRSTCSASCRTTGTRSRRRSTTRSISDRRSRSSRS